VGSFGEDEITSSAAQLSKGKEERRAASGAKGLGEAGDGMRMSVRGGKITDARWEAKERERASTG